MKKTKRILALVLVVLLVLLYLSTLVFALLDAPVFTSVESFRRSNDFAPGPFIWISPLPPSIPKRTG